MKNKKAQGEIITTVLIILLVLAAIVIVWKVVNYDYNDNDTNYNELASKYVKEYYPEYKDCKIEYDDCLNNEFRCYNGVNVYCDNLPENRDSLVIQRGEPTRTIKFDGISIEEIEEYYKIKNDK